MLFFSLKKLNLHIQRDKSRCPLDECHCHGKCRALFTSVTQPRGFVELLIFAKRLHRELFISTQNKPGKPAGLVSLFLGLKLLRTYYGITVSKRETPASDPGSAFYHFPASPLEACRRWVALWPQKRFTAEHRRHRAPREENNPRYRSLDCRVISILDTEGIFQCYL